MNLYIIPFYPVRDVEVGGSNPPCPTTNPVIYQTNKKKFQTQIKFPFRGIRSVICTVYIIFQPLHQDFAYKILVRQKLQKLRITIEQSFCRKADRMSASADGAGLLHENQHRHLQNLQNMLFRRLLHTE